MRHESLAAMIDSLHPVLTIREDGVEVLDRNALVRDHLPALRWNAALAAEDVKRGAQWVIREAARSLGIRLASVQDLYAAMGRGECGGFTVPAVNIRGLVPETAGALLRAARKIDAGAVVFELARSEMGYTDQRPAEYAAGVLAACIAEGWTGPVFIQGDHFQLKAASYAEDPEGETAAVRELCREAVEAGFYNIDIDSSTLVDLSRESLEEQQEHNAKRCAELTAFLREIQPGGVTIAVGGEIGEVGQKNSTVEELRAFMAAYRRELETRGADLAPIGKISVQTGTSHGGVPLPDGSVAEVKLDFDVLRDLSLAAREEFGMAGAVQHGASTLPDEAFHRFVEAGTAEVHLATGFQNLVLDHERLPATLRDMLVSWMDTRCAGERKPDQTDEQFHYKLRKKVFGPFKAHFFALDEDIRTELSAALETKFDFLLGQLAVGGTRETVERFVEAVDVPAPCPAALVAALGGGEAVIPEAPVEAAPAAEPASPVEAAPAEAEPVPTEPAGTAPAEPLPESGPQEPDAPKPDAPVSEPTEGVSETPPPEPDRS